SNYACDTKRFTTFLLSTDPLVIYIEDFLTVSEADHLISIAKFEPSTVGLDPRVRTPTDYRKLWSAELPDSPSENFSDSVIECVVDRASAFQGYVPPLRMETLQLVKYGQGEFYDVHYDAFGSLNRTQGNRESSFFVTLRAKDVVGGATSFPRITKPASPELCSRFLDCTGTQKGLLVKPKTGSAIFWRNLRSDHSIHPQTLHSGLKVASGEKIGMNIWT
ncbi:2OG-Fe(II) oxygenase superfamily protein, partial [Phyllosticta citriasiana]|uniref:2OG-Fe(II) oxygenase superfamily protein n=1 Tax=Phyllosticta citriasiana TaxID=595635 RepID=UPI0030FD4067